MEGWLLRGWLAVKRGAHVRGVDSLKFFRWRRIGAGTTAVTFIVVVVVVIFDVTRWFLQNGRGVGEKRSGGFRFGGPHHILEKKSEDLVKEFFSFFWGGARFRLCIGTRGRVSLFVQAKRL